MKIEVLKLEYLSKDEWYARVEIQSSQGRDDVTKAIENTIPQAYPNAIMAFNEKIAHLEEECGALGQENEKLRKALTEFDEGDWKNKNDNLKMKLSQRIKEVSDLRTQLTDLGNTITEALNDTDYVPF